MKYLLKGSIALLLILLNTCPVFTQDLFEPSFLQPNTYQGLRWRNIGPFRGGRVNAVAGLRGNPLTYFFGSTGGGVWKTEDAGLTWRNISDGYFTTGSIGAIGIAPSDQNIIYVGTGEHAVRGVMSSHGDGVYRSEDGGNTWRHIGLSGSRHIAEVIVHPENPDLVYVAVQGAVFGPTEDRGVYRSKDGGRTWDHILFIDESTGACDLSIDPSNPRVLYAGTWDHERQPWKIRSGGPGSGIWKSIDGGDTWRRLTNGLPELIGKVGVVVSPVNPQRLYAVIEAEIGGVFRSTDGGEYWEQISTDRRTVSRAWYYTELVADPQDAETIYILNADLLRSIDGGRTFQKIDNPHTDQHGLWVNPDNPQNMILGNDGGACVTFNGGISWSAQNNQPTGQFYRVLTDARFPYNIYGAQQDNTTISIASQSNDPGISTKDWYTVSENESAFVALDPANPSLIYGSGYQGNVNIFDTRTKQIKDIMAYPVAGTGARPKEQQHRFNWNAPLIVDPLDPRTVYHGADAVLRTRDGGYSWVVISGDLTRNEKNKQGDGGGPFTNEGAGAETYNTISYLAHSSQRSGEIWAGTDDGLVHLTRNGGNTWENITPPQMGEGLVNCIEVSPHNPARAYVVFTRHKFHDFSPLIYSTNDYGQNWKQISRGIPIEDWVHVVREDPERDGLLYAGTETGFYISTNNGEYWNRFQLNLPITAVTDLQIQDGDLVAATSGRGFWILDNLASIRAGADLRRPNLPILFKSDPAVRIPLDPGERMSNHGENPPAGILIDYFLPYEYDSLAVRLEIYDENGKLIRLLRNYPGPQDVVTSPEISTRRGINRCNWDLYREALPMRPQSDVYNSLMGGMVKPGVYTIRLVADDYSTEQEVEVQPDPRLDNVNPEAYDEQEKLQVSIEQTLLELYESVGQLRQVRDQIKEIVTELSVPNRPARIQGLLDQGSQIVAAITDWEEQLINPRLQTAQDLISFENRLDGELIDLHRRAEGHDPLLTYGTQKRLEDLLEIWKKLAIERDRILQQDVDTFNRIYQEQALPAVIVPQRGGTSFKRAERLSSQYRGRSN